MGPFYPILAAWQSGCVLSNSGMTLTSKAKVFSLNSKTLEITSDLNPISHRPFNPILATLQSGCVLFNPGMTLTSKEKLLVIMVRPLK